MIRHLAGPDYRVMPWANGRGTTTELWREDRVGRLVWRLSRASVVEDGPFSLFPGVERNLTVLTGPGFDLVGDGVLLRADPFRPIAFGGDMAVRAAGVLAPSDDFNVMTAAENPKPEVLVLTGLQTIAATEARTAVYFTGPGRFAGNAVAVCDLIMTDEPCIVESVAPMLVVILAP